MTDEAKIKALLEILEQDRKQIMLYVGVCFAVPVFTVSDLGTKGLPPGIRWLLLVCLAIFAFAGLCYFIYSLGVHKKRLEAIDAIMNSNSTALRQTLFGPSTGVWAENKGWYVAGNIGLILATLLFIVFFVLRIIYFEIPGGP